MEQLDRYADWLRVEMLPRTRPDNQLPEAVYAANLRTFGVRMTPEELITLGQYSYQLIRSEMKSLAVRIAAERGWDDDDLVSVLRALKREQVPQDQVLDLYRERLETIEAVIRRERLITLPDRDASIRLATEAESAVTPASFMSPPQLIGNTGQYGEFVLVQTNPSLGDEAVMDDWSHDAITWALTAHEARPGHELQFAALVENGTSQAPGHLRVQQRQRRRVGPLRRVDHPRVPAAGRPALQPLQPAGPGRPDVSRSRWSTPAA